MATKRQANSNQKQSAEAKQPRVEPEEPFREPDEMSDVVLIVEGTKLYAHRSVLGLHSPVFKRMFVSDFKERDAKEIPLPDKKLASFVTFLKLLYPVHSLQPITDDVLSNTMALADEYQVEHIQRRFDEYIGSQITSGGDALSTNQLLTYLCVYETHQFSADHRDRLIELAAQRTVRDLKQSAVFASLPATTVADVALKRCQLLEDRCGTLQSETERLAKKEQSYQSLVESVDRLKNAASSFQSVKHLDESCSRSGRHDDIAECHKPYNKKHYCRHCVVSKLHSAILHPLLYLPTNNSPYSMDL